MKRINKNVYDYLSSVNKIEFRKSYALLESNNKKYIYFENHYNKEIYNYLEKIQFRKYYKRVNDIDDEFSLVLEENNNDMPRVNIISDLYEKSLEEIFYDESFKKKIYDKIYYRINELKNYYYSLQDSIEEMLYPKKEYYDLLINISIIHHLLELGEMYLNKWVESSDNTYKEVLMIKKINEDNFKDGKILDFSSAKRDIGIFEMANYYQMYYNEDSVKADLDILFSKTNESDNNKYLFYSLITNIGSLEEKDIYKCIEYSKITYKYILEKNEEDKENKNDMFNEKEKNI